MSERKEKFQPKLSTLSIESSDSEIPEHLDDLNQKFKVQEVKWEESQKIATADTETTVTPMAAGLDAFDVGLKAVELVIANSEIVADPKSIHVLPLKDPDGLNYMGETFRAPAKGTYKKLFWTDSLWPCGNFTFYFNITSRAHPVDPSVVPDGYYISNISIVPVSAWAYPLCKLSANLLSSKPVRSETANGLAIANIDLIVDLHLIKVGIFDWKSKIKFKLAGDKCELKLIDDPLPSPF